VRVALLALTESDMVGSERWFCGCGWVWMWNEVNLTKTPKRAAKSGGEGGRTLSILNSKLNKLLSKLSCAVLCVVCGKARNPNRSETGENRAPTHTDHSLHTRVTPSLSLLVICNISI
jgi:hypothetical protein